MKLANLTSLSPHFLIYKNGDNNSNYLCVIVAAIMQGGEYNVFDTVVVLIVNNHTRTLPAHTLGRV